MNYPIWNLDIFGGGLLIALIATVHVFVAHFAVGGGLYLYLFEKKAYKENSTGLLAFVKKHTTFFLLLTMVFGGMTGVGIWFTISLLNPQATSQLIHTFVFGWAAEWVCFFGEILALFLYAKTFDKISRKAHLQLGLFYFIFAWLSLFLINGIIGFMLTPGSWIQNGNFWAGFFNPSFFPSLVFRTLMALMLAGIFGLVRVSFEKDDEVKALVSKLSTKWIVFPAILLVPASLWYYAAMPAEIQAKISGGAPEVYYWGHLFIVFLIALFVVAVVNFLKLKPCFQKGITVALFILSFCFLGAFEMVRESGRRPYIISDYLYSNSIRVGEETRLKREGLLANSAWFKKSDDIMENGKALFQISCSACHSIGGPLNDIVKQTEKYPLFGMEAKLDGLGKLNTYMPPFMGNLEERHALAKYLVEGLHPIKEKEVVVPKKMTLTDMPEFSDSKSDFVLLAWNNLGMHCISDSSDYFIILPPANDLFAQLIYRGSRPKVVTEGFDITYEVENGFKNPAAHVPFWNNAKAIFGADLQPNVGLAGNGVNGQMHLGEKGSYEAKLVPVVPYQGDEGHYNPYPVFKVRAISKRSGKVVASTKMVAPTSTEMGCKNCHGGPWRVDGVAGFSDATSADILAVHDRINHTNLLANAQNGKPVLCQSCHEDPVLGTKGVKGVLGFPAAVHGWHANFLSNRGAEACAKCHPANPAGPTRCLRGVHAQAGLSCISCHGTLEDHALSLLKKEDQAGKPSAKKLMAHLKPRIAKSYDEIKGRTPWVNEPDCLSCHEDYKKPVRKNAYNRWTEGLDQLYRMRTDKSGVFCEACHGSTHANYPAVNDYERKKDNIQTLQYQGSTLPIGAEKNCTLCHKKDMEEHPMYHHPNFKRKFRSSYR